ncbi:MAG: hypothetical protein QXV84_03550 [Conexivisphaerales archaeon]
MFSKYTTLLSGKSVEELEMLADQAKSLKIELLQNPYDELTTSLKSLGLNIQAGNSREFLEAQKEDIMIKAGLAYSKEEVADIIREFAVRQSEERIRRKAGGADLQVIQSISSVDELDKMINLLSARVREWYGLHFPELDNLIQDPLAYCRFVSELGDRSNVTQDKLKSLGYSNEKTSSIIQASKSSKGGSMSSEDISELVSLASTVSDLSRIRDKLMKHVERNMERIAPNLTAIVGAAIGARLIAKAGSLERLSRLPSSTIQVLGAEKALFRALKSGGRPPKHGILFQHTLVHSSAEWLRGKIARILASKLSLAVRIDFFRGQLDKELVDSVSKKIAEVKLKYPKPKKKKEDQRFARNNRRRRG